MPVINLTNGGTAQVDEADFKWLSEHKWMRTSKGYARTRIRGVYVFMHRLLTDACGREMIDHINRDRLDNRRENLRFVDYRLNAVNRGRVAAKKLSQFKGVYWNAGKYEVKIKKDGKSMHVGRYACEREAARAYNDAARRLHGETAYQNEV